MLIFDQSRICQFLAKKSKLKNFVVEVLNNYKDSIWIRIITFGWKKLNDR